MRYWLISDLHLLHAAMTSLCGRPLGYELQIEHNWCNLVKPQDIILNLGDICMGKDEKVHDDYIKLWPGKKILVRGNHDNKSDTWYLNHGWDFVCDSFTLRKFGQEILFSHKPQPDDGNFDLNIHGHFHNTDHHSQEPDMVRLRTLSHRLFALEYHNYSPMLLETFLELCQTSKHFERVEVPLYPNSEAIDTEERFVYA